MRWMGSATTVEKATRRSAASSTEVEANAREKEARGVSRARGTVRGADAEEAVGFALSLEAEAAGGAGGGASGSAGLL